VDRAEVDELLAGDAGLAAVREGEEQACRIGVSGVPIYIVNGEIAFFGAQSPELFPQTFENAGEAVVAAETRDVDPARVKRRC
jgi:predicted DsbA family dithiol-disulfide isomerase